MSIPEGTLLGPFEILDRLGSGGMGEVYRARDTRLGREVAVKALPTELLSDQTFLQRFAQEARSASALNHPNIITIFEIGQADSIPFMAMELIEGRTLRDLLARGPLSMKTAVSLASQLADGLAKAHEAGIVHRDLKPENLMVSKDGFLKILDFGLAKVVGPFAGSGTGEVFSQELTGTGFVIGTAGYMSPEQASGKAIDFRSDQFSAGLIIYEMVAGRRAFDKATPVQTLSAIIQDEPEPLERLAPKLPLPFKWAIERCLAKDPDERYASTRDLVRDLKQLRENLGSFADGGVSRSYAEMPAVTPRPGSTSMPVRTHVTAAAPAMAPAPARVAAPVPQKPRRRVAGFLSVLLLGLVFFAAGAGGGFWFRGRALEGPAAEWQGELLLGPSTRVLSPRISPDGSTLAFVTIQDGAAQVAVMKPASGDWTVLTKQRGAGSIYKLDWSRDGARLFFDRVTDVPGGIYSVPALGGDERLVLPDAQGPESLPDGSLLAVRIDAERNFQPHRFWPDTGKNEPVGPHIVPESLGLSLRATSDGTTAVFWGKLPGEAGSHAYALDLASGKTRRIAPELPLSPPIAIGSDGRSLLAVVVSGDLYRVTSIAPDGGEAHAILTLTSRPASIAASREGLFVNTLDNPVDVLKFAPTGGVPERLAGAGNLVMVPVQLPDGRIVVPSLVAGRRRLLVASAAGNLRSLVESSEAASPPAVMVSDTLVAFVSGGAGKRPTLAVASVADGRIVKRLESTTGAVPQGLAASPDGKTLYYVDAGSIFSVDIEKGEPKKLRAGNGVAVDGRRQELLVQLNEKDGVKLLAVPLSGGPERPILYQTSALRLAPMPLSAGAVGTDGRIVVTVASKDSWYWGPALLDPATGAVEKVPVIFDGDVQATTWGRDGNLVGMGVAMRSQLWRFRERSQVGDAAP